MNQQPPAAPTLLETGRKPVLTVHGTAQELTQLDEASGSDGKGGSELPV